MNYTKFIPYIILVALIVFGGYQFKQHHDTAAAYSELNTKYNALKNNSKQQVQKDATKFLTAFYTYEGRPKKESINGLTTKKLQNTLFQTYDQLDQEYEMPKDLKYKSEIDNTTIYHARDEYDSEAKVLATFDSIISINNKKSNAKTIAEINLKLQGDKWIVTGYKTLNDVSNFEGN
ncbi:hypothetical protein P9304_03940 [Priestia flexa]|uniref:hypothetical protein n=1 Tax=Priestia flexa TaxID=86664 RepID=UPI00077CD394|nr:hypothetical protein [Priestia flexa]MED4587872.1 hypothetical protein [Priestia flexa]